MQKITEKSPIKETYLPELFELKEPMDLNIELITLDDGLQTLVSYYEGIKNGAYVSNLLSSNLNNLVSISGEPFDGCMPEIEQILAFATTTAIGGKVGTANTSGQPLIPNKLAKDIKSSDIVDVEKLQMHLKSAHDHLVVTSYLIKDVINLAYQVELAIEDPSNPANDKTGLLNAYQASLIAIDNIAMFRDIGDSDQKQNSIEDLKKVKEDLVFLYASNEAVDSGRGLSDQYFFDQLS